MNLMVHNIMAMDTWSWPLHSSMEADLDSDLSTISLPASASESNVRPENPLLAGSRRGAKQGLRCYCWTGSSNNVRKWRYVKVSELVNKCLISYTNWWWVATATYINFNWTHFFCYLFFDFSFNLVVKSALIYFNRLHNSYICRLLCQKVFYIANKTTIPTSFIVLACVKFIFSLQTGIEVPMGVRREGKRGPLPPPWPA